MSEREFYFPEVEELDKTLGTLLSKNEFALMFDFRKLFTFKKVGDNAYMKVITKGLCETFDYRCGVFALSLRVQGQGHIDKDKKHYVTWHAQLHAQSGDDSGWSAWSPPVESKEKAIDLVEKLFPIFNEMASLPTLEDIGTLLRPYGMYVADMY